MKYPVRLLLALLLFASPLAAQTKPLDTLPVKTLWVKTVIAKQNEVIRAVNANTARLDSLTKAPAPTPTPQPPAPPAPPAPVDTIDPFTGIVAAERFAVTSTAALRASPLYDKVESKMTLVSLDTAVRYSGHATARVDMPANSATLGMLAIIFPSGGLGDFWLRVKLRYSPGFTTTGTLTSSANSIKLITWGWAGSDRRGTLEITNTTQHQLWWDNGSSNAWADGGSVRNEWSDGLWYDYIVHYQKTSATSTRTRVWIVRDGQAPVLRATVNGSGSSYNARNVGFPAYFNQQRRTAQSLWVGEWVVVDGGKAANPFGVP